MISMTQYWEIFERDLKALVKAHRYYQQNELVEKTFKLVDMGKQLETYESHLDMQETAKAIGRYSKKIFGNLQEIAGKERPLPNITDPFSLIFATLYYKHLWNFETIEYRGNITTYMWVTITDRVVAKVNSKKPGHRAHAVALREKIDAYCTANDIPLNDATIFPEGDYDHEQFIASLLSAIPEENLIASEPIENEGEMLKREAKTLKEKLDRLYYKRHLFLSLQQKAKDAKRDLHQVEKRYYQLPLITRMVRWFFSWFIDDALIQELSKASVCYQQADDRLNGHLSSGESANDHLVKLSAPIDKALLQYQLARAKASCYQVKQQDAEETESSASTFQKTHQSASFTDRASQFFKSNKSTVIATATVAVAAGMTYAMRQYAYDS